MALERSTRKASFRAGAHQAGCVSTAAMGGLADESRANMAVTRFPVSWPAPSSASSEKRPCSRSGQTVVIHCAQVSIGLPPCEEPANGV